jgi:peptidoglycan/LPS O-acetylase OafA/YrhL
MQAGRETAGNAYRYRYFGTFRLLLASLVMAQHFGADLAPAPLAVALAPFTFGSSAVLVFFALSGFVITEAIDSVYHQRPGAFFTNRLLRIVPHFLLAVALAMLAHELFRLAGGVRLWRSQPSFPSDAFALKNIVLNLLAILPMGKRIINYDFLTISWAVRIEMAFYLVMAASILIGQRLPWNRGFIAVSATVAVLLLPWAWLAVQRRGPGMLMYTPFFAFGAALYFATMRHRTGIVIALLSLPVMVWVFVQDQLRIVPIQGVPLSVSCNLAALLILLSLMAGLAFATIPWGQKTDQKLGDLTYPLYLYHEVVLIVILTLSPGYAYTTLALGILLSFMAAAAIMKLVDPVMTRYRDQVRGRTLWKAQEAAEARAHSLPIRRLTSRYSG